MITVMISYEELLSVAFELTLFAMMIILSVRVYKSNLLPLLYKEIERTREHWHELHDKRWLLITTGERIESEIELQKHELELLEEKVKKWHLSLLLKKEIGIKHREALRMSILNKRAQQRDELCTKKLISDVIPMAMNNAILDLERKYKREGNVELEQMIRELS